LRRHAPPAADGPRALAGIVLAAAVLGVWMDLSPLHRFHDSDSLVPVLMSLYRWAPFYWDQNRFGMLVPLLARPVADPYHNLLLQEALRLFAVVLSFFLLARAAVPRPYWPAVGALTLALFVAGKGLFAHCYFAMQPYGQSTALALAGLLLLDRLAGNNGRREAAGMREDGAQLSEAAGRVREHRPQHIPAVSRRALGYTALAALCFALAFWVSLSTLLWLLPFLLLRHLLTPEPRWRAALPFLLALAAFAASAFASRLSSSYPTDLGPARLATWPAAWQTLAWRYLRFLKPRFVAAGAALFAGTALAALARRGGRTRLAFAAGLCLIGTAAAELAALGTSSWVHLNDLSLRFAGTGLLAAATAVPAMLLVLLLEGRPRWHAAANALAVAALVPLVALRFGPPSPAAARAAFDRLGRAAPQVVAAGCTHVAGDYWRVWPTVLRADQLRYERGQGPVWGVTYRSLPTADLWRPRSWRAARVATFDGDAAAAAAFRAFGLPPLFLTAVRPGVRVYSAEPPPGEAVVSFPPALTSEEPAIR